MNKAIDNISNTCDDVIIILNAIENIINNRIKERKAKPNKAGFTNYLDAGGIGLLYSLNSSMEYHLQRAKECELKAQANSKRSGSAMFWGETEHRSRVVADCIQDIMQELNTLFKKPSVNIARSWDDLRSVEKAVEIPLSAINEMREKQGLQPLTEK